MRKRFLFLALPLVALLTMGNQGGCQPETNDSIQQERTDRIIGEAVNAVGLPSIKNLREYRLLKDIYERRDQAGFVTYTYLADLYGHNVFFCQSIGYPIPYSAQLTNPQKPIYSTHGNITLSQAEPNGLFTPPSAEGSWVVCKDPNSKNTGVVYVEPRVITSPFPLHQVTAEEAKK